MAFLKNLLHPLKAQDTSHLTDGEIALVLRHYQWGSAYVGGLPSYYFKIVDANDRHKELGNCDLRVGSHPELVYSGQVGYRVHKQHRGNHYAAKATRLMLHFAYELGMRECIITCDPDNQPSRRTLAGLGGELRATVTVPETSACYKAGDRAKCQFYFNIRDFYDPARHNEHVHPVVGGKHF